MSRLKPALRERVRQRANGLCEYCRSSEDLTGHEFTIDHIIPESGGGTDSFDNLCFCCIWCNSYKQARTEGRDARTDQVVPLFSPRAEKWHYHFRWSSSGTRVVGRTATGPATIKALRLNRAILIHA